MILNTSTQKNSIVIIATRLTIGVHEQRRLRIWVCLSVCLSVKNHMAQGMQWPHAIHNNMRKVKLRYEHVIDSITQKDSKFEANNVHTNNIK